jgi:hypothetical protein
MKYIRYLTFVLAIVFILFSAANACESKGEITGTAAFSLGKNQCHRFRLSQSVNDFFQITVRQNGVDVDLRLFKDNREIATTDSENLNSGIEFLPFVIKEPGNYTLDVGWVDDRQTMIKTKVYIRSKSNAAHLRKVINHLLKILKKQRLSMIKRLRKD